MECKWSNCKEVFNNEKDFAGHVNRHIKDPEIKTCSWRGCSRVSDKKISKCMLLTHIRMHTKEKPFKCTQCNKEYSRPDALNKHARTHEQMSADENIHIKKLTYLTQLLQEAEIQLKEKEQQYKRLIVENDIFLKELNQAAQRVHKRREEEKMMNW